MSKSKSNFKFFENGCIGLSSGFSYFLGLSDEFIGDSLLFILDIDF